MDNKILTYSLISASFGVVVGGIAGAIITRDKYRKMADEEIEEVKAYYSKKLEKLTDRVNSLEEMFDDTDMEDPTINEDDESENEDLGALEEEVSDLGYSKEEDEYQKIIDGLNAGAYDYTNASLKKKKSKKKSPESEEVYHDESVVHISIDEFVDDDNFDKASIEYYTGDRKWLCENEDDVTDLIEDMLGIDISHEILNVDPSEPVYIRNLRRKTDYEVIIKDGCMEAENEV